MNKNYMVIIICICILSTADANTVSKLFWTGSTATFGLTTALLYTKLRPHALQADLLMARSKKADASAREMHEVLDFIEHTPLENPLLAKADACTDRLSKDVDKEYQASKVFDLTCRHGWKVAAGLTAVSAGMALYTTLRK